LTIHQKLNGQNLYSLLTKCFTGHPTPHHPPGPPSYPQGTSSNHIVSNERQADQNAKQLNQMSAGPQNSM
jgi:hypothetical protein